MRTRVRKFKKIINRNSIKLFDRRFLTNYGFSVYNLNNMKLLELTENIDDILDNSNHEDNLNFVSRAYMDKIFLMSMKYNDLSALSNYISNLANNCLRIFKQSERLTSEIIYQFIILHNLIKDIRSGFFINFGENIDKVVHEFNELFKVYQHQSKRIDERRVRPIIDDIMEDYRNMNALIDNEYLFSQFVKWQRQLGFFAFSKYAQRIGLLSKEKPVEPVEKKKRGRPPKKKPETVLNVTMLKELTDSSFNTKEKLLVEKLVKERKKRVDKKHTVSMEENEKELNNCKYIDKRLLIDLETMDDDDEDYNLDNFVDLTDFKD